jgi:hypothetical protein
MDKTYAENFPAYEKIGFKNKKTPCINITKRGQLTMVLAVK